jgi:hypothetical protein
LMQERFERERVMKRERAATATRGWLMDCAPRPAPTVPPPRGTRERDVLGPGGGRKGSSHRVITNLNLALSPKLFA